MMRKMLMYNSDKIQTDLIELLRGSLERNKKLFLQFKRKIESG